MRPKLCLTTIELRYALTMYLFQHGPTNSLRPDVTRGRVRRLRRGLYGPGEMPRATEYRIHTRVLALREQAAALTARDDDAFWDALPA